MVLVSTLFRYADLPVNAARVPVYRTLCQSCVCKSIALTQNTVLVDRFMALTLNIRECGLGIVHRSLEELQSNM